MKCRAFTLTEMLCVLAIAGVLLALGAPSWRHQRARAAVSAAATQTLAGLALARRTALATGRSVTLCLTRDLVRCDVQGAEWMLFTNGLTGTASTREVPEPLLKRWPLPAGVRVGGSRGYANYLAQLRAATTVTFDFCHPAIAGFRRSVIVSQTGRPRLSRVDLSSTSPRSPCP